MMNMVIKIGKKIISRIRWRIKLKMMDDMWFFMGGSCFGMFSPSFYYTHTQEEIESIVAEEEKQIQKLMESLQTKKCS